MVVAVALLWFRIPFRGDPLLLVLGTVLFLLSALGLGLLISSISNTQQEAFMAAFLVFLPAMLLRKETLITERRRVRRPPHAKQAALFLLLVLVFQLWQGNRQRHAPRLKDESYG